MARKIFISYRRDDVRRPAQRLYERFSKRFGRRRLVMDVDDLPPGRDFREALRAHVEEIQVMLVLIDPDWADLRDGSGRRRLSRRASDRGALTL